MIISASRRTDIPTFYSEWLEYRVKEGFLMYPNPRFPEKITQISLSPEVIDAFVFWTKNPIPLFPRLGTFAEYPYYFQWTVTAYGKDVESRLPAKGEVIIPAFQKLSRQIGKERLVWRYDPIFFTDIYTMEYHKKYFRVLCHHFSDYTDQCTFSFYDNYLNSDKNSAHLGVKSLTHEERVELSEFFLEAATENGITLSTCAESVELSGITHARCIDGERIARICGDSINAKKDKGQRKDCGCVESIDIGVYSSCKNGCFYCYANGSPNQVKNLAESTEVTSPLICGMPPENAIITEKKLISFREQQISLY